MDSSNSKKSAQPTEQAPRDTRRGATDAFDVWLQRGLHQLYDSVAAEPIPPELLRLIEADKSHKPD